MVSRLPFLRSAAEIFACWSSEPTAPNSTASADVISAQVSSGIRLPNVSHEAMPKGRSRISIGACRLSRNHSATLRTSPITSGPMPSPGRISRR